jgi:hypothetical protein
LGDSSALDMLISNNLILIYCRSTIELTGIC